MEKEIKKWLEGERENTEGVALYNKYGKNTNLKKIFLTKDNAYTREKLAYELGKLIDVEVEATPKPEVESEGKEITEGGGEAVETPVVEPTKNESLITKQIIVPTDCDQSDYPEELKGMIIERGHLVNEKGMLSNSLDTFAAEDNEGRKAVMDKMSKIRERINEINEVERYVLKHKKMPTAEVKPQKAKKFTGALPTDGSGLLLEKKGITEKRSKLKSKLAKCGEGSPEGQNLSIEIAQLNERYEAIEKALAGN